MKKFKKQVKRLKAKQHNTQIRLSVVEGKQLAQETPGPLPEGIEEAVQDEQEILIQTPDGLVSFRVDGK